MMNSLISKFKENLLADELVPQIEECIISGQSSFVDLVTGLESLLVSVESVKRAAATQLLADVLQRLPRDYLTEQQLTFLVTFFVDRTRDHTSVIPAVLHATIALLHQCHVSNTDIESLVCGLIQEVHCQSQLMQVRTQVYTALQLACTLHPTVINEIYSDFVLGVISAADGEKDPRNLLQVFSLVPLVAASGNLGRMAEDLFEVVAAYFPIDFVPPAHDPHGVTSIELVEGLRECLACTAVWSSHLLPLLTEKMESDLPQAKVDAYLTLSSCCQVYSWSDVSQHVLTVWGCARRDVVADPSSETATAALKALRAITRVIYSQVTPENKTPEHDVLLDKAVEECSLHLCEGRLSVAASALLTALVLGSPLAAKGVCSKVLPSLCSGVQQNNATALTALAQLMTAVRGHEAGLGSIVSTADENAVESAVRGPLTSNSPVLTEAVKAAHAAFVGTLHWPSLATLCVSVMLAQPPRDNSALRTSVLEVLCSSNTESCTLLSEQLLPAYISSCKKDLDGNITMDEHNDIGVIPVKATELLFTIRKVNQNNSTENSNQSETNINNPGNISNTTSYLGTKRSNSNISSSTNNTSISVRHAALAGIVSVTVGAAAVATVLDTLWPPPQRDAVDTCVALAQMIDNNRSEKEVLELLSAWCGVEKVSNLAVRVAKEGDDDGAALLGALSALCRTMVATTSSSAAVAQAKKVLSEASVTKETCVDTQWLVHVLDGLLVCLRDVSEVDGACEEALIQWAVDARVKDCNRAVAAVLLATLLNKMRTEELLCSASCRLEEQLRPMLTDNPAAVNVWGEVVKGMEMRASPRAVAWMSTLESLLNVSGAIGLSAAQCYAGLLRDHPYALSTASHCTVRLLYRQRVFQRVIGGLVEQFEAARGAPRRYHLLAIASLLPHVPAALLHAYMPKLVGVVVEGVRCHSEAAVVGGVVRSLRDLLTGEDLPPPQLAQHAGALLPALVTIACSNKNRCGKQIASKFDGQAKQGHACCRNQKSSADIGSLNETDETCRRNTCCSTIENNSNDSCINETLKNVGNVEQLSNSLSSGCALTSKCCTPYQPLVVRESSLVCLKLLARLPQQHVLPYREEVLRDVRPALDDHKRLVRRAAAEVRCEWMMLAAPGT